MIIINYHFCALVTCAVNHCSTTNLASHLKSQHVVIYKKSGKGTGMTPDTE